MVGRSNSGKSSIINAVCSSKKLAFTSKLPGKTRTLSVFSIGPDCRLVDLPGYGYATGPASERKTWAGMIEGYLLNRPALCMVYVIISADIGLTKLDHEMLSWLSEQEIPFTVVANKIDKVKRGAQTAQRKTTADTIGLQPEDIFWVSAENGTGINELARSITTLLTQKAGPHTRDLSWNGENS